MDHHLSNFELDLHFIAASFKPCENYSEEHWQKLEERLNRLEHGADNELMLPGEVDQFLGIFKLKCKLFKK